MLNSADTPSAVACLTPPGAGAIATLGVRGPLGWPVTRSLFRGRLPEQPIPGNFYLGRFGDDQGACDEVVLAVKDDCLELHCHGGLEVVRFIQEMFAARGVRPCSWHEHPVRPAVSPLQRLALEQLVQAPTVKTAAILLDQVHGALADTLAEIRGCYEADSALASRLLGNLVRTQHLGRHLVKPFRVVIAGAPNAGKSSLVNALVGFTRCLVSPIPGTTRDVVTTRIALYGWPVELIDTAGLHASTDALEQEGINRALAIFQQADLCLWVVDACMSPVLPPREIRSDGVVVNKVDLPAAWNWEDELFAIPSGGRNVSAKTGQGITALCEWIGFLLGLEATVAPREGVAFTPYLSDQILRAHEYLRTDREKSKRILEDIPRASVEA